MVRGKADADAFVSDVLSPGYFGEDGYGSDRPEALSEEESALITDDTEEDEDSKLMPPVVGSCCARCRTSVLRFEKIFCVC